MNQEDAEMFKPSENKMRRHTHLGVDTYMPMLRAHLAVNNATRKEVCKHILMSQRRRNKQVLHYIVFGRLAINIKPFAITGRAKWIDMIKPLKAGILKGERNNRPAPEEASHDHDSDLHHNILTDFFKCQGCGHAIEAHNR